MSGTTAVIKPENLAIASIALPVVPLIVAVSLGIPAIDHLTNKISQDVLFGLLTILIPGPVIAGFVLAFVSFYRMSPDQVGAPFPRWASICAILGLLINCAMVFLGVLVAVSGH